MEHTLAVSLPPLRRKILRSFLLVVALYGLLGVFMLSALFLASGITPTLIHVNYDSIAAATQMREALVGLRFPEGFPGKKAPQWEAQFDSALKFEESNITEPGEDTIAKSLRRGWNAVKSDPIRIKSAPVWSDLHAQLDRLINVNERGMFNLAERSTGLRERVLFGAVFLFFITIVFALYLADGLAERVARPLKEIAEALRRKPVPGQKLKLPTPTSLEMRILTFEMGQLWKRLSELRQLNIEEIYNQRSQLGIIVDAVEDAILVLDGSGKVLQCNGGLARIIQLPEDGIVGQVWGDLSTGIENYLRLRETLNSEMSKDSILELSVDGKTRCYAARSRNILNKADEPIGVLYLLHDITEVRQRERLKAEFIGVLSHELKTPLQSLGTAAELLVKRKDTLNEEGQMLVDTIYEDVERIRAVAQDIVQVNFVDPHILRLRMNRHPINRLLQEWIRPFRLVARDRQVKLAFEPDSTETVDANIDEVKFPWAISNLLSNAIRFSPAESTVTVRLSSQDGQIRIEIVDEGPGIPEEVRRKMFDPYFQAPPSDSKFPSGFLGLGLTIAKEVVEAHQGKIDYIPGQPRGSIFRISLPGAPALG